MKEFLKLLGDREKDARLLGEFLPNLAVLCG